MAEPDIERLRELLARLPEKYRHVGVTCAVEWTPGEGIKVGIPDEYECEFFTDFLREAIPALPALLDRLEEAERRAELATSLVALLEKLLSCYRLGRHPGALLDKIGAAYAALRGEEE